MNYNADNYKKKSVCFFIKKWSSICQLPIDFYESGVPVRTAFW